MEADSDDIQHVSDEKTSQVKPKNLSFKRFDSMDIESSQIPSHLRNRASKDLGWSVILHLAFQSLGVVYGDLVTSPLYVCSNIFSDGVKHPDDVFGVLSLLFYTLTIIVLIKYMWIVMHATDNGEGGTFALYSLICRYAKVGMIPTQQAEDAEVSNYRLELPNKSRHRLASALKAKLENSDFSKYSLLFITLLGTSMLIGDGILTPCISVLSAVIGIKQATPKLTDDMVVWISAAILVILFMVQRYGTDKVGYTFAPIMVVWCTLIGGIGVFNIFKHNIKILAAINPWYIVGYFKRNPKQAWISLGDIVLCITGIEALFADVGHFSVKSIQLCTYSFIYPSVICAYAGECSYLSKHPLDGPNAFYKSVPGPLYWPMFVVAVFASIIGSQSLISGSFSIIQQSLSLGCFPNVKVVRTSDKYEGQVYIPEVNYLLMLACLVVTFTFRTGTSIGNAYGLAVVFVLFLTSCFMVLVMLMIWKTNIFLVILYVLVIGSMELLFLSSVLYKFPQGGFLPLVVSVVLISIMFTWNTVYRKKYYYDLKNKVTKKKLEEVVSTSQRVPGLAMFYSDVSQGIPPIFNHYVENIPALHSVIVVVSIKSLPISKVQVEERFLFRRVEPRNLNMFRCVARYGYMDLKKEPEPFEKKLIEKLKDFIREDFLLSQKPASVEGEEDADQNRMYGDQESLEREIQLLDQASQAGISHLISENAVVSSKGSNIGKRILIDYAYNFLEKNSRKTQRVFNIPQQRLLKVGMTYEI